MPDNWKEKIEKHDAIFFGAVGMPDRYPDHITLWGSLLKFRREFDQYINLRPVKLFPGVKSPLADKTPGDIDMIIIRENTEGEYSSVGGRMYEGTEREIALQETIMSKHGIDRVQKFAFEVAKSRKRKKLTSATKSNGISITMPYWDERFNANKKDYSDIKSDKISSKTNFCTLSIPCHIGTKGLMKIKKITPILKLINFILIFWLRDLF